MSNWPELSIDELKKSSKNAIAMGPFGSRIKAENFVESGVPVIKGGNLNGDFILDDDFSFLTEEKATELKASNVFRRDIVITHRGTIGQVGIIPDDSKFERYVVSQSQLKVTLDQDKVNPYFVYYFLRSPLGQHRLLMNASQVGVPAIAQASTSVKGIMVPCPDKGIQDAIVEMLLNLDHKIELNRQINQTLEDIAQAIFKSWFVDFDPTRAKITAKEKGQNPELAAMAAIAGKEVDELEALSADQLEKLKSTAALFPESLIDSELGEIPERWEIKLNGDVMDVRDGTHDSPKKSETGFPLVTSKHITSGVLKIEEAYLISEEDYEKVNKRSKVNRSDILMTMIGTVGIPYLVLQPEVNFAIKNVALFKTSEVAHLKNYFYLLLKSPDMQAYLEARMAGTTQKYLSLKTLRSIDMLVPTNELLTAFNDLVNPLMDKVFSALLETNDLVSLRDTLLPKLLSGEIDLVEQEKAVVNG